MSQHPRSVGLQTKQKKILLLNTQCLNNVHMIVGAAEIISGLSIHSLTPRASEFTESMSLTYLYIPYSEKY